MARVTIAVPANGDSVCALLCHLDAGEVAQVEYSSTFDEYFVTIDAFQQIDLPEGGRVISGVMPENLFAAVR